MNAPPPDGRSRDGTGPPLVLLHGILADSRAWLLQFEAFSQDHTVVAWDAPGCGQSSDPPETFRMPDYADCLAAFIEALDLERPRVLGLSFGAVLALELYRRHPAIPRALLLASSYGGWAGSLPNELIAQRVEQAERESELPAEQWVPEWVSGLLTSSAPAELTRLVATGPPRRANARSLDNRPGGTAYRRCCSTARTTNAHRYEWQRSSTPRSHSRNSS